MSRSRFTWTPERVQALRELYPDNTAEAVAEQMGGTAKSIYYKAHALGLTKSEAFKASEQSGRILRGQKDPRMTATQFKAGHTTWNKGKPGTPTAAPRSSSPASRPRTPPCRWAATASTKTATCSRR